MLFNNILTPFALALRENGTYTPFSADAWEYAGQMTLLGMVMVFSVLAILWGVLAIFKLIFAGKTPKAPKPPKAPKAPQAPKAEKTSKAKVPVLVQPANDDAQLIAVITAAVAAYMAEEGTEYAGGFRVVSFKRVRGGRTWNSK